MRYQAQAEPELHGNTATILFECFFFLKSSTAVHLLFFLSVTVQKKSYLDPLQSGGGLGHILRHVEAFGRADLGVDQPLLEVSEGGAEPLLQQPLLVLALPGRPEAEAGGAQEEVEKTDGDGWRQAEGRREGRKDGGKEGRKEGDHACTLSHTQTVCTTYIHRQNETETFARICYSWSLTHSHKDNNRN